MSAVPNSNPTAVNSFTGLSDNAVAENKFQSLFDAGAFEPSSNEPGVESPKEPPTQAAAAGGAASPSETPATGEGVAAATAEPEGPEYTDLADYLTKSQIEAESFYKMPVTVKIDGKTQNVPLADVLKSYQLEADYTRKTQVLADQRKSWEAEQTQLKANYHQQLEQAKQLLNIANQQALHEFQNVDWNELYRQDPGRFAAEQQRFQMRVGQIQQHFSQAQAEQQRLANEQHQKLVTEFLPAEREKLLTARPEWRDEKQFEAARTQMMSAARKFGFSDAELGQVYDHRILVALDLASRYVALQAQAPDAVRRVRTAPIAAQPGARTQRDPKAVQQTQLREAFKKNPRDQDRAAAYFGTLA